MRSRAELGLAALGLAAAVLGGRPACGPDPIAGPCAEPCDDLDPCTVDRCDPAAARCVFVPIDVEDACRVDRHCDDGHPCTVDRCGVDPACGFQRCVHAPAPGCDRCFDPRDCEDGDPCSVERCEGGFCVRATSPDCDLRCDVDRPMSDGLTRVFGTAEPSACACPCDASLVLVTDAGPLAVLAFAADGTCAVSCGDGAAYADCDPLVTGERYAVWGAVEGAGPIVVTGWCLAPSGPMTLGALTGTLTLDGFASLDLSAVSPPDEDGFLTLAPIGPRSVPLDVAPSTTPVEVVEGLGRRFAVRIADEAGLVHELEALLYPSANGFAGAVRSSDPTEPAPLSGRLRLEVAPGPQPVPAR